MSSPEAGDWRAVITGAGRSDIYFIGAEFVKEGGRPGHEGLFRIPGQPLAGIPAILQASLSAKQTKTVEFYLVSERGETIQRIQMGAVDSDLEFLEFTGSVDLPNVPFRVAVMGNDTNGQRYQRFFSNLFHAENVEVAANPDFDELVLGDTRRSRSQCEMSARRVVSV